MTGNVFINKGVVVGNSSGGGQPVQEITQAEYDNLSQEDKMKDIIYLITDAEGGGGSSGGKGGIDYSLEEQNTGLKWIDGKDIYQLTLTGALTDTDTIIFSDVGNFNIIEAIGFFYTSDGMGVGFGGISHITQWREATVHVNPSKQLVAYVGSQLIGGTYYITIKYTKNE